MIVPIVWEPYVAVPSPGNGPGDGQPLAALEQAMAVSLPGDIRQIILEHPGEVTEPSAINVGDTRETPLGPVLYAGGRKDHERYTYSVEFALEKLQGWAGVDSAAQLKLFPFANNSAGSYFCVDFRESQTQPPIVFVDLDYDVDEHGAFKAAAPDLASLLAKLHD